MFQRIVDLVIVAVPALIIMFAIFWFVEKKNKKGRN